MGCGKSKKVAVDQGPKPIATSPAATRYAVSSSDMAQAPQPQSNLTDIGEFKSDPKPRKSNNTTLRANEDKDADSMEALLKSYAEAEKKKKARARAAGTPMSSSTSRVMLPSVTPSKQKLPGLDHQVHASLRAAR